MAATNVTVKKLSFNTAAAPESAAALNSTDGALIPYTGKDHSILLIFSNTTSGAGAATLDVVISKGNGIQATDDLKFEIATGATKCVTIESGKYMFVSGTKKGKVEVKAYTQASTPAGSAGISVQAIELP